MDDLTKNPHIKIMLTVFYVAIGYYFVVNWLPNLIIWILPFFLAYTVAYMTRPIVRFLTEKWHLPEKLSAIISLLLVLLSVGSIAGFVITKIILELIKLAYKMPIYLTQLPSAIKYVTGGIEVLKNSLSPEIASLFDNSVNSLTSTLDTLLGTISKQILISVTDFATSIPATAIFFLVFIISSVFFCIDYQMIVNSVKRQFKPSSVKRVIEIKGYTLTAIYKYFRGVLIISSIIYLVQLTGLLILGIDYAFLLAFIIAFFDMLPLIGAGLFLIPWGLYQLITGNLFWGIGLLALWLATSTIRQLIEPKIMSKSLGLYPIVTLLAIYIGLRTLGFLGVVLFPIIILVLIYLQRAGAIKFWRTDDQKLHD